MMRPRDGTSGLVRGNRRKAVFAFKGGCFLKDICHVSALGRRASSSISEVRGKSETSDHPPPEFFQQNCRSQMPITGVWLTDLGFPALPETFA